MPPRRLAASPTRTSRSETPARGKRATRRSTIGDEEYEQLSDEELRDRIRETEELVALTSGRPEQSGALEQGAREMLSALGAELDRRGA